MIYIDSIEIDCKNPTDINKNKPFFSHCYGEGDVYSRIFNITYWNNCLEQNQETKFPLSEFSLNYWTREISDQCTPSSLPLVQWMLNNYKQRTALMWRNTKALFRDTVELGLQWDRWTFRWELDIFSSHSLLVSELLRKKNEDLTAYVPLVSWAERAWHSNIIWTASKGWSPWDEAIKRTPLL